jgi:putative hemolysin
MIPDSSAIFLFIFCLLLSAFFSGSEVALISINQAKVRTLIDEERSGARALAKLKENADHLLITILIGNNVVNVSAAALATMLAIQWYGDVGVGIATGVVTILMLVFGEIGPKTYAARTPVAFALFAAKPVLYMSYLLTPVLWLFDGMKKHLKIKGEIGHPAVTEEEIKQWIDVGEETGTLEEEEHEMLCRVFRFGDTTTREIMTPRADVVMIDETSSLVEAIKIFEETGFSRLPVYHIQMDDIVGILNVKDVFSAILAKKENARINDLMYNAHFVPESQKIDVLLKELQISKIHMAVVLDEYGTFAGIVTIEDMLEELVGEILDEFDVEEPEFQDLGNGEYIVDARAWVDRLNEELEIDLPLDEAYETIGGLLIDRLGHIPRRGEFVEVDESGVILKVLNMRGRRIVEVKMTLPRKRDVDNDNKQNS